jgi:hypothetical protein
MAWVREEAFETGFACRGETVIVRVTRAGTLEMEGYDLEYDQASMEFYGDRTPCYEMYKKWDDSPAETIVKHFNVTYYELCKLAIDWAEHVSWMVILGLGSSSSAASLKFTHGVFGEMREYVDIEGLRSNYVNFETLKYIPKESLSETVRRQKDLEDSLRMYSSFYGSMNRFEAAGAAVTALANALDVAKASEWNREGDAEYGYRLIRNSGIQAARAAVEAAERKKSGGGKREKTWQVRRFIDVMSSIKHKQPWPPLKFTK